MDSKILFRISKLLGKISSNHDGEILGAVKMAHKLVIEQGLTWDDLLLNVSTKPPPFQQNLGLKDKLIICYQKINYCNKWEHDFIESIYERYFSFGKPLTDKQELHLNKIYEKVSDL